VVVDPGGEPNEDGNPATKTIPRPGTRTHYGLLAQDVKAALDKAGAGDFGGYIKTDLNNPESEEGLRYDQFIAPLIRAVQELSARVEALEGNAQRIRQAPAKQRPDSAGYERRPPDDAGLPTPVYENP
jgi:hypothetical protein